MYYINYLIIFILLVFEFYVLCKVMKVSSFKSDDMYVSQFLIEGIVMFIISNLLLFFTINFFGKSKAFVNQFFRISYLLILCKATLLFASYTFNHLSISKKTDIVVHILLILSYAVPIILVICTPIYINIVGLPITTIEETFRQNSLSEVVKPSFIQDVYMYILGYAEGGVFFNKIALIGWAFVIFAYLSIIISTAIKQTRIHAKRIEYYYMYQVLLIYIILNMSLVGKPVASCIYITYYAKVVFEVVIFLLLLNIIEKSEDRKC